MCTGLCCLLQRLATIVSLIPGLGPATRLLDVGSGTGCLIPHLQSRGVADITAVDLSPAMLEQLASRFPAPSVCGNDPGARGPSPQVARSKAPSACNLFYTCWYNPLTLLAAGAAPGLPEA